MGVTGRSVREGDPAAVASRRRGRRDTFEGAAPLGPRGASCAASDARVVPSSGAGAGPAAEVRAFRKRAPAVASTAS